MARGVHIAGGKCHPETSARLFERQSRRAAHPWQWSWRGSAEGGDIVMAAKQAARGHGADVQGGSGHGRRPDEINDGG